MLEMPIFPYDSEFVSDDDSNFLEDFAYSLIAVQKFYGETLIPTGSIELLQASRNGYLFIVSNHQPDTYDVLKVSGPSDNLEITKIASFEQLKTGRDND